MVNEPATFDPEHDTSTSLPGPPSELLSCVTTVHGSVLVLDICDHKAGIRHILIEVRLEREPGVCDLKLCENKTLV